MDSTEDFLPKDKFDFDSVEKIKNMDRKEIIPLLPGLLEWIRDLNWPIAADVAELLLSFPKEIVPYVKNVLRRMIMYGSIGV